MAQNWNMPLLGTRFLGAALKTDVSQALETLRTCHSGSSEPASPVAYMLWADTSTDELKIRNSANTAWVTIGSAAGAGAGGWIPGTNVTSTQSGVVAVSNGANTVSKLRIVVASATSSSSGNEWRFQVARYPASNPAAPVNLFSGAVGTFTTLAGVYTAGDFGTYDVADFAPNQNANCADGDVLVLQMTKVGTVAPLAQLYAEIVF